MSRFTDGCIRGVLLRRGMNLCTAAPRYVPPPLCEHLHDVPLLQVQRLCSALQKEQLSRDADASSAKWSCLSKINQYQHTIQQLTQEAERAQEAFRSERAELQVGEGGGRQMTQEAERVQD